MSFLLHSLSILLWMLTAGAVLFGSVGVLVARALGVRLVVGWFAGMLLGPIGITAMGLHSVLRSRRERLAAGSA